MYRPKSTDVWFNLPGVVAAYQPIAAPDPFAAPQNVAHGGARFGVYTATPGVAPTWGSAIGWGFNGTTQYFTTGVVLVNNQTWSLLVRFSDGATLTSQTYVPIGAQASDGAFGSIDIISSLQNTYGGPAHAYESGGGTITGSSMSSGVLAISGSQGYKDGISDGGAIPSQTGNSPQLYVGCRNYANVSRLFYFSGCIQALVIASRIFSPAEVWLASRQMAYCEANPDWNAWKRRRQYYYASPVEAGVDTLIADSVTTAAPTYGTPALSQIHAISGISISTGAPTLGTPAITQVHELTATGVATGAPTLGTPVAAETHALAATGIATGAPTLGTPAITQVHALTATEIATGAPTLGTPVAAETHALAATGIATGAPTLGTPAITQVHLLTAPALDTTSPSLALPAISQLHVLVAMIIATGAATVGTPYLVQGLMVAPSSRTFSVPAETRSNNVAASSRTRTA